MTDNANKRAPGDGSSVRKEEIGKSAGEGKAQLNRRKRFLFVLILIGAPVALSLLLMEAGVRFFYPQPLSPPLYMDTSWGFRIRSNLSGAVAQTDARKPYRITTDENGFRGVGPTAKEKAAGAKRILVVGDSFTFGVGVDDGETFPALTEEALNRSAGGSGKYEVVNAGCPGWGTENALAFWLERGRLLKPDLLVVVVFRNDFTDNMRKNLFEIRDGKAVFAPKLEKSILKRVSRWVPFYEFLCGHSHLLNLLRRVAANRPVAPLEETRKKNAPRAGGKGVSSAKPEKGPTAGDLHTERRKIAAPILKAQTEVFKALMEAFIESTEREKVPMLVLLLPGTNDITPYPSDQLKAARLATEEWAEAGRIEYLNPYDALLAAVGEGKNIYLPTDHHFTPEGNRIVGELLGEKILSLSE